ncbi:MAG: hypothetical protein A3G00_02915 [Candidatus Magasanikbacteria bacterium RIFCSPLOWO2_12_FULL_43_12]|uniref:DUF2304 domain-containing protein n=1 Tax=Candidatus Magasanikbacteria bacterium RIFCSPLOWO2_12_FULL_43_12 TaxID=1798692 RepID=A0A1F6MRV1_9BACT|nr:MAG: hypothetical protein A3I93_01540 [Candidatus Magasanikbacteria bacterium RIFCSPLOWO2_02_FULL_43_22]OGH74153.1 MAG: hypothetical protein A3G00_02915 [Candidatus Magasanikbacteria bacterium RIFCSPLOWO2_12_FULL_43_12]
MLILFQLLFILFSLFAIISVIKRKREGLLGPKGMIFWIGFWLLAVILVLWPNSTGVVANYLGIGRGADLVFYVSLVVIFYLLFKLNVKLESLGRDVTKVVRAKSLENEKFKNQN